MDSDGELSHCTKDADLWFPDGSIMLRAGNTLFKVYSGMLGQASPVFKDMLSLPQSTPSEDEMYEDLLVVRMPDSAADLKPFLKAIHDGCVDPPNSYFDVGDLKVQDIPMVVSVLRLSTKYHVSFLRKRATEALLRWYPSNLDDYSPIGQSERPLQDHSRHVLVANAARETDVLVLLPAALLLCSATANTRVLYDGLETNGEHYTLVDANRRAVFFGRLRLSHAARSRTQAFFFYPRTPNPPALKCSAPERCNEFCRIYSSVFDEKEDPWMNPFYRLNWKAIRSTCCVNCASGWEVHHAEASHQVWQEMPSYFDLSPWTELIERSKVPTRRGCCADVLLA
ncbi:uncharacterized protein PHACADRAFT_126407 [Phanerochaete carnosa HHB-10118-sp]|uniref:BTB domain-containing protein n=1 Tax=Phanerochaete carnosa (strain HHB-10118-sp) TaxID=650164 RepID=K5WQA5_PHACS|nr:uncharacterized protein PHACADRAFT_126407 [Phanerochaete carnosa HHB-10118-sp]EKM52527.1 hypothetical protein PHACADRAFT_126407 [Phanerochaete carnosa HHB-10118-sp]